LARQAVLSVARLLLGTVWKKRSTTWMIFDLQKRVHQPQESIKALPANTNLPPTRPKKSG
jgi:hypothetical protein